MLARILRALENQSYPRRAWAAAIADMISPVLVPGATIVDAPCGGGVIAFRLARSFPGCRLELRDISGAATEAAIHRLRGRADVRRGDVRDLDATPGHDLWILVNSWFLLDDPDSLVRSKRVRFAHLLVLCDDVESENYRAFCARHPEFHGGLNRNAQPVDELIARVEGTGYRLIHSRPLGFIPLHARNESLAASLLFSACEGVARRRGARPGYWAGLFERTADDPLP